MSTPRPDKQRKPLRSHKHAFLLLTLYIPLILIPWLITGLLATRPLTKSTWAYAPGFSHSEYAALQAWARAVPILNALAAVLAVPVTSALGAQAAVVLAERRYDGQRLSLRHLFGLADRVWCDWRVLGTMWRWREPGSGLVRRFVGAVAALVFLGAVQFPLLQILAPWEVVAVPTCADTHYIRVAGYGMERCDFNMSATRYTQIGIDLEPAQMAVMPASYVLPRIRDDLSTVPWQKVQPYLWQSANEVGGTYPATIKDTSGFVASLPAGTTTGVLRQHIMRLNSTVSCAALPLSDYPASCSGANPLQTSFDYTSSANYARNATVDICAPGEAGKYPWTLSRNRQELSEELFIRTSGTQNDDGVLRCFAQTTRGYFELGNAHNKGVHGPLLLKWPDRGFSPYYHFNDYFSPEIRDGTYIEDDYIPSEEDQVLGGAKLTPDPDTDLDTPATYTNMSGPLMSSALALFGNDSWAHSVRNLTLGLDDDTLQSQNKDREALLEPLCQLAPFRRAGNNARSGYDGYRCARSLSGLHSTLYEQLTGWTDSATAEYRLRTAVFLANKAVLTSHLDDLLPWSIDTGREIYTAPGVTVSKPHISLPALVILSIIVGVQIIGLLWLGWFIYTWPTWTRTLNAIAIARIVAPLDPDLFPPLENVGQTELDKLAHTGALVGVHVSGGLEHGRAGDAADSEIELVEIVDGETVGKGAANSVLSVPLAGRRVVRLGLEEPGLVAKRGKLGSRAAGRRTADV